MNLITAIAAGILHVAPHMRDRPATALAGYVVEGAATYEVDPWLVVAVVAKESSWRAHTRGKAGEVGLGQLLPSMVAARYLPDLDGHDQLMRLFDQRTNLVLTARHLAHVREQCGGKPDDDPMTWAGAYSGRACRVPADSRFAKLWNDLLKWRAGKVTT